MFQAKSTRYKEVATALGVLVLSVSIVAAAELLLRFDWWNRGGVSVQDTATPGKYQTKGQTKTSGKNTIEFRGPELSSPKSDEVVRLAFLGGSATRDVYSARDETTWPHQAYTKLQTQLPKCRFEYVNAGQNGYSIAAMRRLYDSRVSALDPDIVVIVANDLMNDLKKYTPKSKPVEESRTLDFLRRHSLFWHHIESSASRIRRLRQQHLVQSDFQFPPIEELSQGFIKRLSQFIEVIKADNRVPVLALIPRMMRKDQEPSVKKYAARRLFLDAPFLDLEIFIDYQDTYRNIVAELAEKTDTVLVDAYGVIPGDDVHYVDSYHLAGPGSARLGRFTGSELAHSGAILSRVRSVFPACLNKD